MTKKLFLAGAAALLATAAMPASAAVVFNSAYLYVNSYSNAYGSGKSASGSASDSDGSPSSPLNASAASSATVVKGIQPQASSYNIEDATATFAGATSGTINFQGLSSATVQTPVDSGAYAQAYGYNQFYYNFTIDSDYNLNFGYNLSSTASNPYGQYYYISGPSANGSFLNSNSNGSFSTLLTAGSYTLGVYDYYGTQDQAYQSGTPGTNSAQRNDLFTFNLTSAVPEPASWAIMLAGFAMIGGALRSRRGRNVAAAFA